ncbi:hypothetical protein [Leptospira weilii]|uniref:hypothetical protein n=1 Tax=Leptospira weilii TaxID=28184 RepID=UPI0009B7CAEF|nr:hypothetical protein [Leptospira weilii]
MSKLPLEVREVLENIQDLAATDSNQSDNVDQIFYLVEWIGLPPKKRTWLCRIFNSKLNRAQVA